MKRKSMLSRMGTFLLLPALLLSLSACGYNQGVKTQSQDQWMAHRNLDRNAHVKNAPVHPSTMNPDTKSVDHPYVHNYDGAYDGVRPNTYTEQDVRSAELLSHRVTQIAKSVPGVNSAQAVAQGIDVVIGIDAGEHNAAIERHVHQKVKAAEPGYNIYVTTNPDLTNRIRTLFTAMTNVRHGQITHGVSGIIYEMGRLSHKTGTHMHK